MANGRKGDHPLTDILVWKIPVFSPAVDALIAEIVQLGGRADLERSFDLFQPPPLGEFEPALQQMRIAYGKMPRSVVGKCEKLPLTGNRVVRTLLGGVSVEFSFPRMFPLSPLENLTDHAAGARKFVSLSSLL